MEKTVLNSCGKVVTIIDLGLINYLEAYKIQQEAVERSILTGEQFIYLCEHPAVITLGRSAKENNFLKPLHEIKNNNVGIHSIDRGGDVTLHCPGQLVVYPILHLESFGKDLHRYLYNLEKVLIDLLAEFDILASRFSGRTGVWVGGKKIASIGIGVKKWVSYHGLGLNVSSDLELYSYIRPCGLDVSMTSVAELSRGRIFMEDIKNKLTEKFFEVFGISSRLI